MNNHDLIIGAEDWNKLGRHFANSLFERMAFGYCGGVELRNGAQALLRELDLPVDSEYRVQNRAFVSLKGELAIPRAARARDHAFFLDAHSHPFAEMPWPSGTDEQGACRQARLLRDIAPQTHLMRMIFAGSGKVWAVHSATASIQWHPINRIVVLGPLGRQVIHPVNSESAAAVCRRRIHERTQAVLGSDSAVETLRHLTVAIIGLGGVGSAVLSQLAGYVGRLILIDPDVVEIHNAPRLHYYSLGDVGAPKALAALQRVQRVSTDCEVEALVESFPSQPALQACREADFVFCCPDHNAVRFNAAQFAARYMKPLIEVGCGGRRSAGQVTALGYHVRLQVPNSLCLACNGLDLRHLEDPTTTAAKRAVGYLDDTEQIPGELITLTTRAAADAVELFFRFITGYAQPISNHLYGDALSFRTMDCTQAYRSDPSCSICGSENSLHAMGDVIDEDHKVLDSPGGDYVFA